MLAAEDASDEPPGGRSAPPPTIRETGTPSPSLPGLPFAVAAMSPLRDGALMAASAAGSVPLPPLPNGNSTLRGVTATQTSPIPPPGGYSHSAGSSATPTHHAPGSSLPLGNVLSSLQGTGVASNSTKAANQVLYGVGGQQSSSSWLEDSHVGIDIVRRGGSTAPAPAPGTNIGGTWGSSADEDRFGEPGGSSQELKATVSRPMSSIGWRIKKGTPAQKS